MVIPISAAKGGGARSPLIIARSQSRPESLEPAWKDASGSDQLMVRTRVGSATAGVSGGIFLSDLQSWDIADGVRRCLRHPDGRDDESNDSVSLMVGKKLPRMQMWLSSTPSWPSCSMVRPAATTWPSA